MLRTALVCSVVLSAVQVAQADFIVGGSFTNVGAVQAGGQLNSAVVTTGLDGQNDPPGANLNTVAIDINFTALGVPVVTAFNLNNSVAGAGGTSEYLFTVTIHNLAIHPINGFDVVLTAPAQATFEFDLAPLPNSGPFAFEDGPNPLGSGEEILRFGGLNGGGGELAGSGGTTSVSFLLDVVGTSGTLNQIRTFGMTFTANPEPTSLLLASSLLIPGAWFARRRKLAQAASKTPAA